jgi:hypothetical protein
MIMKEAKTTMKRVGMALINRRKANQIMRSFRPSFAPMRARKIQHDQGFAPFHAD